MNGGFIGKALGSFGKKFSSGRSKLSGGSAPPQQTEQVSGVIPTLLAGWSKRKGVNGTTDPKGAGAWGSRNF